MNDETSPASDQDLATLVGAALLGDQEFRDLLFEDPMQAASQMGLTITAAQASQIQVINRTQVDHLSQEVQALRANARASRW